MKASDRNSNIPSQREKCEFHPGVTTKEIPVLKGKPSKSHRGRKALQRSHTEHLRSVCDYEELFQLEGFMNALECWYDKTFRVKPNSINSTRLFKRMVPLTIGFYPKWFKDLLCWNFSKYMDQELPQTLSQSEFPIWELFSGKEKESIRALFTSSRKRHTRKARALWDLLQCKSLCTVVPDSFKLDALRKHYETMKKIPLEPSPELKEEIRSFILPWVEETFQSYDGITKVPNRHSNYQTPRSKGGNLGYFIRNKRISNNPMLSWKREERFDPIVIHIEGPPGFGKSTLLRKICHNIQKQFGILIPNHTEYGPEVYTRSAATDHWDGYKNQLITIIDDFGFDIATRGQPTKIEQSSLSEFIQLCSDVEYVLPMADLRDKGRKFTSKFLLVSSNSGRENCLHTTLSSPKALARRISPTYVINGRFQDSFSRFEIRDHSIIDHFGLGGSVQEQNNFEWVLSSQYTIKEIVKESLSKYIERREFLTQEPTWPQPITFFSRNHLGIRMKMQPPEGVPRVRACVVMDPLKARIITSPEAETYCLKPLQLAMFNALKRWKCFEPCWNPDYDLSQLGEYDSSSYLLSGDYSSATDNLNYHISQICIQELANRFERTLPHLSNWIRYEGQKHIVEYSKDTGIPDVFQENGQLMGSLLSFPILTILNSFTLCKAQGRSLDTVKGLFHGDDIAAQVSLSEFESWKSIATSIGLELSKGKNYLSRDFVSIDSQLFIRNAEDKILRKVQTGKFKLVRREEEETLTCKRAWLNGFSKEQIRRYCSRALTKTTRSLDVPESYGGLGPDDLWPERPLTIHEKVVYLASYDLKSDVKMISDTVAMVEKGTAKFLGLEQAQISDISEDTIDSDWERDLRSRCTALHRRIRKSHGFAQFVKELDLKKLRPISSMRRIPVHCERERALQEVRSVQSARLGIYPKFKSNNVPDQRLTYTGRMTDSLFPIRSFVEKRLTGISNRVQPSNHLGVSDGIRIIKHNGSSNSSTIKKVPLWARVCDSIF